MGTCILTNREEMLAAVYPTGEKVTDREPSQAKKIYP